MRNFAYNGMISLSIQNSSVQNPTHLCFLEYCLVITPTPVTITPTAIMIYPFTVHSGLLYMNEAEGPREDSL
jgi:hypothetical protein